VGVTAHSVQQPPVLIPLHARLALVLLHKFSMPASAVLVAESGEFRRHACRIPDPRPPVTSSALHQREKDGHNGR